ncbi:MAG: NAD-dependent epimerase/dehydratase family protein [Steroidobacteraceae bacterium]|nr:NAD-dependent epimerase/dehydratase family protein [Steroidobacteraceae bacterium]
MKAFVTGATGFTGGHLARELRRQGHEVRALVRPGSDTRQLRALGVQLVEGQLTRRADVVAAVAGCDVAFHVAAVFRTAGHSEDHYREVNVGGTVNVLEAARLAGCELVVHCSTGGVHGHVAEPPAAEDYRFGPDDVYQQTKVEAEREAQSAIARGQRVTVFRPGAIYGEGDLRFLKLFRAIQKRRFVMLGSGRVRLHMVHVDDLVDGIVLCSTRAAAVGEVFLLAGPEAPTLDEIVATGADLLGVPRPRLRLPVEPFHAAGWLCEKLCVPLGIDPPLHRRRVGFFTHHREFDIGKARRLLDYAPRIDVATGLARTLAWYVREGLLAPRPVRETSNA